MRRQHYWYPEQKIFSEGDFPSRNAVSGFSDKTFSVLVSSLKAGELQEARVIWRQILASIKNDTYRDQIFALNLIAQSLLKTQSEMGLQDKCIITEEFLEQIEDIEILTTVFDEVFKDISKIGEERRRQRVEDISTQVKKRIDNEYMDFVLSPTDIADELGMNSVYLGQLFRKGMDMSISDYMNQVRVKHAIKFLEDTDLTVKDIAAKVGYANSKYFFVVFKKVTGFTPLQYRKGNDGFAQAIKG